MVDDVKEKIQEILQLLSQDISILVQDAVPFRNFFEQIKAHISDDILETLTPVAFIEYHEVQVTKAKKRLADSAQNAKLFEDNQTREAQAKELHRRFEVQKSSRPDIIEEIDRLTARQAEQRKELQQIGNTIKTEEAKLRTLSNAIQ